MKTPSLAIGLTAAAFGLVLAFTPRLCAEAKGCKIMVQFKRVVIPVTKLTPPDAQALDRILKNYDKSLYKIVTFNHGVAGPKEGFLQDKYICEEAAIIKAAKDDRQSGEGIQVGGKGCNPNCGQQFQNDKLVAEVENLLKRYCP